MFGTMGFSELIIILIIILIIFGAGRLPQIGEGVGKALKGFRKEVNEAPSHHQVRLNRKVHNHDQLKLLREPLLPKSPLLPRPLLPWEEQMFPTCQGLS